MITNSQLCLFFCLWKPTVTEGANLGILLLEALADLLRRQAIQQGAGDLPQQAGGRVGGAADVVTQALVLLVLDLGLAELAEDVLDSCGVKSPVGSGGEVNIAVAQQHSACVHEQIPTTDLRASWPCSQ